MLLGPRWEGCLKELQLIEARQQIKGTDNVSDDAADVVAFVCLFSSRAGNRQ